MKETEVRLFSKETYAFFRGLKRNNHKPWFKKNEERYQTVVRAPTVSLIERLPKTLGKTFPEVAINRRCISRINRDIRFSANKAPYKTFVALVFQDTHVTFAKESGLSLYFGFDPTGFTYGAGMYIFEKTMREKFRQAVVHPVKGKEFAKIIAKLKRAGFEIEGVALKKVPPGYDPNHPNAEYLRYNGLYASRELDPHPAFFTSKNDAWMAGLFTPLKELYLWMRKMAIGELKKPKTSVLKSQERKSILVELPEVKTTDRPEFDF